MNTRSQPPIRIPMNNSSHDDVRLGLRPSLPALWRFALVLSRSRDTADDLVQATCVRALERAGQYEPGTRLDRWLFSILHSIWVNEVRSRKVRQGSGVIDAELALIFDGRQAIETNILAAQMLAAIGKLPEPQREAVLLVYAEGFSYQEAATFLGIPIGTIMSRLAAARGRLAELNDNSGDGDGRN
ncbi:RNA polymerase sigma factor [Kaistia soli]|uniref:RNA polymerase sigma factor n=1 Tax=Kaistia soli TaxID=446684 RepID=UPI001114FE1D|nr:RNA polymerase sigma factor [Kaistia soli]